MHLFFTRKLISAFVLSSSLFNIDSVAAQTDFQYSLGVSGTSLNYDGGANGYASSIAATFYINPVKLAPDVPYSEAGFWSQTSGVSLLAKQYKDYDLGLIRGGNVLQGADYDGADLYLRFADKRVPFWGGISVQHNTNAGFKFVGVGRLNAEDRTDLKYTVGMHVFDLLNIDLNYLDCDCNTDQYELSVDYLLLLGKHQSLGLDFSYSRNKTRAISLDVERGAVRNLVTEYLNENEYFGAVSYFPDPRLRITLSHRLKEFTSSRVKHYSDGISASYFSSIGLELGVSYFNNSRSYEFSHEMPDAKVLSLSAVYRF